MFGGKGGVGKTTTRRRRHTHCASRQRTLIISSDLTPSLSDIFETEIGAAETPSRRTQSPRPGNQRMSDAPLEGEIRPRIYEASRMRWTCRTTSWWTMGLAPGIQEGSCSISSWSGCAAAIDLVVWVPPRPEHAAPVGAATKFLNHLRQAPRVYLGVRDRYNERCRSWS
jgi:hypothetical protein